jgi:hypothetical protein
MMKNKRYRISKPAFLAFRLSNFFHDFHAKTVDLRSVFALRSFGAGSGRLFAVFFCPILSSNAGVALASMGSLSIFSSIGTQRERSKRLGLLAAGANFGIHRILFNCPANESFFFLTLHEALAAGLKGRKFGKNLSDAKKYGFLG